MTQETKQTLQKVIDSIGNPAYIEENNKIVLSNKFFNLKKISQKDFKKNELELKTTELSENTKLCEVLEGEVFKLNHARQKLLQAMALL